MNFWNPDTVRAACGGTWIARPSTPTPPLAGLSIDSRSLKPGEAFLALKGESFDGHAFLGAASAAGAGLLIVQDKSAIPVDAGAPAILVPDTRRALGRLAAAYRAGFTGTRVIAVGGSNGKTTTTSLIHQVLGSQMRGTAPKKSFNNDIGVPLTVLSASPTDQYLVCEIGTNHPGELAPLAAIVRPDIAIITSIGREHLEGFGSLAGVVREEASLLDALAEGGVAIATADSPLLAEHLRRVPNKVTFGVSDSADLRLTSVKTTRLSDGRDGLTFRVNDRREYVLPLVGEHNASNALPVIAAARRLGLDDDAIARALAQVKPPEMRLNVLRTHGGAEAGGITLLNDAYNANPESMLAALRTLASFPVPRGGRRVAIIGDMLELGPAGAEAHREIARALAQSGEISAAALIGPLSEHGAAELRTLWSDDSRIVSAPSLDAAALGRACALARPGDVVLVKASRGMRLERVVEAVAAREPARA